MRVLSSLVMMRHGPCGLAGLFKSIVSSIWGCRNPGAAVVDVWKFVTNALRMTRYLHTPSLFTSFVRSVLVVVVVILFCALVFGLDKGLSSLFKIQSQG